MREGWSGGGGAHWQRDDESPLYIRMGGRHYYVVSMNRATALDWDNRYRHTTLEQAMLVVETMDLLNEDLPE